MPDPRFAVVFGTFLRRMQESMGTTQLRLAKRLDMAQSTLSEFQSGDINITASTIDEILDVFGMDVGDLCRTLLAHELKKRGRPPNSTPASED